MKNILSIIALLFVCGSLSAQKVMPLYSDSIPNSIGKLSSDQTPDLTVYLPAKEKATGAAVIIFPGGAYAFLATSTEGTPIAEAFLEKGIAAFVVKYRLPNSETMRDKSYGPLMDAQQAIKTVRMKAADWNIDPKKIGIIGYSAGGHLASTLGTHFKTSYIPNAENVNLRPDFMILVYPVISMKTSLTHMGSRINLIGMSPSPETIQLFSNEEQVDKDTPPTYLTHCGDDAVVDVNNSIVFYQALQRKGVDAELHLFAHGNHGFTQRQPVKQWLDPMLSWLKEGSFLK